MAGSSVTCWPWARNECFRADLPGRFRIGVDRYTMSNLQADRIMSSGKPLKDSCSDVSAKTAAYEYFARSMTERFASADLNCAMCGQACEAASIAFTWRANLHTTKTVLVSFLFSALAILAHHLYSRWVVVEFTRTFHRLCPDCRRRHRARTVAVSVFHKVLGSLF